MISKVIGTALSAAMLAGAVALSAYAMDDDTTLRSPIIGSVPGVFVGGVASGGAQWKVAKGEVTLENTGRLRVEIFGLLLLNNTTGPVREVAASLVCGGSGGIVVATSALAGLSAAGNAEIRDVLTLPSSPPCQAPVVLIRNATSGTPAAFIALSGIPG